MSNLAFYYCPKLTDATGFGYVRRVTESFGVKEITSDSLFRTENLNWAATVSISDCKLKNLKFLSGLDSILWNLIISGDISSLSGLENLKRLGGILSITNNNSLQNLSPINDSIRVGHSIRFLGVNKLDTISGFNNVDLIGSQASRKY